MRGTELDDTNCVQFDRHIQVCSCIEKFTQDLKTWALDCSADLRTFHIALMDVERKMDKTIIFYPFLRCYEDLRARRK